MFSVSFVGASENAYDGDLSTLSISDVNSIDERLNTVSLDSVDESDDSSLGIVSEDQIDEIESDNWLNDNETQLLRANNNIEENSVGILAASADDEILSTEYSGTTFSGLIAAINNAQDDVVYLTGGTIVNDLNGPMQITNANVRVIGGSGDSYTTLDGQGRSRIMELNAAGITLQNIRFVNGAVDGWGDPGQGAAIRITQPNAHISNCIFEDNTAREAGAIYITPDGDGAVIEDSSFTNNIGRHAGGAMFIYQAENCLIDGCDFTDNHVYDHYNGDYDSGRDVSCGGGAIWSCESETTVRDSTFIGNNASYGGALRGGFDIYDSYFEQNVAEYGNGGAIDVTCEAGLRMRLRLDFQNSTFVNNTAKGPRNDERAQGGAIHIFDIVSVDMTDCTCVNNTADRGGGVDFYQMQVTHVENCTFDNNIADHEGGGVAIFCSDNTFKDVELGTDLTSIY